MQSKLEQTGHCTKEQQIDGDWVGLGWGLRAQSILLRLCPAV